MRYLLLASSLLSLASLYFLALASNKDSAASAYQHLLWPINFAVGTALLALVIFQLMRLRRKLKAGVFGSKLTLRLLLMFSLVAVLPGAIVYLVSFQFLTRSIDTWFDVRVDNALDRGLSLGHAALDHVQQEAKNNVETIRKQLDGKSHTDLLPALFQLREQQNAHQLAVFTKSGTLLAFAGDAVPLAPNPSELMQLGDKQILSNIDTSASGRLTVRVLVPLRAFSLHNEYRILLLTQLVPEQLSEDASLLESIRADYKSLSLSRKHLQFIYTATLSLTLLLALLSVLALAFFLSDRLSAPLTILAAGTRAVAQGDFRQREAFSSRDELGVLTLQFNRMTRQLAEARDSVERQQRDLAAANEYLESLLANLSTGVLTFDQALRLRSANASAQQILGLPIRPLIGVAVERWETEQPDIDGFARCVADGFEDSGVQPWQTNFTYEGKQQFQTLLLRGIRLPSGEHGFVLVFDDVTDLLLAQRQAAWGEIARRLAHEIKNPLTPIQLSAERLQRKLSQKLQGSDREMLKRSTLTIVNQVCALKNMVDEFREYARATKTALQPLDLNALIQEVLALYESSSAVVTQLSMATPFVAGDAKKLRQVLHNLLQNAQDAVSATADPRIEVSTTANAQHVRLVVSDNGIGFPTELLPNAFEPYVTTKTKGTGLGLAIVKKISEEHHGKVWIQTRRPRGVRVILELPRLPSETKENA